MARAAAVPLVLLHGWCGTPDHWAPMVAELGPGTEVIAPPLTHDGSLPELPGPCIVAGHSMGATLARRLLRHQRESILAAVFIDGHLPKHRPDPARREPFLQKFRDDYPAAAKAYMESLMGPHTPARILADLQAQPMAAGLRALEALNDPDVCAWLGTAGDRVEVPVLALWASPSPMARVGPEHEAWMREWCTKLRYECWPGESHFLHLENPERFVAALRQFLEFAGL